MPAALALGHYTPLRYPGGKGKLAPYIKSILRDNSLTDGEYVEPYAGGAAVAVELLLQEYVQRIHINDISRPIYALWRSVLSHTDDLCRLVRNTRLTISTWDKQRRILRDANNASDLELGFAAFYLNRTNRSGILNAGVIGGRAQKSEWGIGARFNRGVLISRIEAIANLKRRVSLTRMDAIKFLKKANWPKRTLIYLDPPYYEKGGRLYYDSYTHADHEAVALYVQNEFAAQKWIVSYDNVPAIRAMYRGCQRITYGLQYSARDQREGAEVIFFGPTVLPSTLVGPFRKISSRNLDSALRK